MLPMTRKVRYIVKGAKEAHMQIQKQVERIGWIRSQALGGKNTARQVHNKERDAKSPNRCGCADKDEMHTHMHALKLSTQAVPHTTRLRDRMTAVGSFHGELM